MIAWTKRGAKRMIGLIQSASLEIETDLFGDPTAGASLTILVILRVGPTNLGSIFGVSASTDQRNQLVAKALEGLAYLDAFRILFVLVQQAIVKGLVGASKQRCLFPFEPKDFSQEGANIGKSLLDRALLQACWPSIVALVDARPRKVEAWCLDRSPS